MWTSLTVCVCMCLVLANASPVSKSTLQLEHCSWGAQYWCSSPQTANLCGKTEWCSKNDWSSDLIQDFPCTVTQQLIKNTRNLISSAAEKPVTESDYAVFVAKGCITLKDNKARLLCKELATKEDVIIKLVKLLGSKLSVQAVSIAVGLCKKDITKNKECPRCADVVSTAQKYIRRLFTEDAYMKLIDTECAKLGQGKQLCLVIGKDKYTDFYNGLINAPAESLCEGTSQCFDVPTNFQALQSSSECEICTAVVAEIRQLDRSQDVQTVVKNLFKSVCSKLGVFEQLCNNLSQEGLQVVFEFIATEMEPDVVCEDLKLCNQPEQKTIQHLDGSIECKVCEFVIHNIDVLIAANVSETDLEEFFKSICDPLPPPINDKCNGFVKSYTPEIIKIIRQRLNDTKSFCSTLGFCNNGTNASQDIIQPKLPKLQNDQFCSVCKLVVTYLDTFLDSNSSEAEIEAVLDKVCTILPGNWSQQCEALVKAYGPIIVELLKAELKPGTVCTVLRLCNGTAQAASQDIIKPKLPKLQNGQLCSVCKLVVTYLDTFLDSNSSEAEIEAALDKVCTILPGNLSQQCEALVKQYGPFMFALLKAELKPGTVCAALKFCNGTTQAPVSQVKIPPKLPKQSESELCDVCKVVVTLLDNYLNTNSSEAEVEAILDKVCTMLPGNLTQPCEALVKQYGPIIVQLLQAELQPVKVCTVLRFCNGTKQVAPQVKLQPTILKKPKDELCSVCKYVVAYLDSFVKQNATVAELENLLDKVCTIIPNKWVQQCKSLVQQYGPLIVQLLEAEVAPDKVCTAIGLCTEDKKATSQTKTQPIIVAKSNDEECDLCKYAVSYLDSFLAQNSTEAEIEFVLGKVCSIVPSSLKGQCDSLVKQYGPLIVELLKAELDPSKVCTAIGLCTADKKATSQTKTQPIIVAKSNDEECDLCKYAVSYLDSFLAQNSTEAEIEFVLEKVCSIVPSSLKQQCDSLVKQYGPLIVELLKAELDPSKVCTAIGLCTADKKATSQTKAQPIIVAKSNDEECDLCKYAVSYLDSFLAQNSTEAEIEFVLEKVCSIVPSSLKGQCDSLVKQYGPLIVELLKAELDPSKVCTAIGLCTADKKATSQTKTNPIIVAKLNDEECDLCKYVVSYLDSFLAQNSTEAEVEALLEKVCSIVPSSLKQQCDSLVKQYGPLIVELLKAELDPSKVCTAIGLCTADKQINTQIKFQPKALSQPNGAECEACKYIVTYLDTFLGTKASEAEVETLLGKVCSILPETYKQSCVVLVKQYGPLIVELLKAEMQPGKVCVAIRLCTASKKDALQYQGHPKMVLKLNDEKCVLCKYLVTYLDSFLEKNSTEAEVEALLEQVCSIVPNSLKQQCDSLVKQYGPLIVQLLEAELDPSRVCTAIGLCTANKQAALQYQGHAKMVTKLNDEKCVLCKYLVTYLDSFLEKNSTEAEVETLLEQVCSIVPNSLKQQCDSLVKQYGPLIVQLLEAELDPSRVCTAIGLCTANKQAALQYQGHPKMVMKLNDEKCVLCKYLVTYLDSFLEKNSTEAEVEALLEQVCSIVPNSLKQQCDSLVKQYGPLIVQLLEAELDPSRVCTAIGLCTANKQVATSQVKLQTKVLSQPNDIKCEGCKYVVTYLDTYLEKNATEQEVEALLDRVCAILPESAKQTCIDFVKQYGPLIVEMLKQGAQPDTVCTALGLCTESKQAQKIAAPAVSKSLQVPRVGKQKTELCALCVAVVQYLEGVLEMNATQNTIISVLDTVCELLPGNDKELCIQQLPMYTGYVVDLIDKELPPNLICKVATICSDEKVAAPIGRAPVKKGELCPLCRIVFTTLENILKKNASEAEIVAALDQVCFILPSTIKKECLAFVQLYIPYVVELIVQELTPDQICETLGLCTAAVKQVEQSQLTQMNAVSSFKSSATCTVCTEIFQILDQILPQQATEAEIEKALDQVCTYLSTYKDDCLKIIAEYTPFVVDFITKKFTPKQICDEIRLCTNGSAVAPKPSQSLMFQSEISSNKATPPVVMKYCSACKFALYEIQTAMEDPFWQNKSKTLLADLCAILESGRAECQQLVDANFAFLLSEITAFRFPIIVCQVMNLCEAPATMQGGEKDCTFCKGLAMVVNSYAQQNKTVDEIKVLAASTCHNSQIATGNQCLTKVQEFTPQLFQLMSQNHDPARACEAAAQCTKSSQRRIFPKL